MMVIQNDFEAFLVATMNDPEGRDWRLHTIRVADTMFLCRKWFESYKVPYTARDLIDMAQMILAREDAARATMECMTADIGDD